MASDVKVQHRLPPQTEIIEEWLTVVLQFGFVAARTCGVELPVPGCDLSVHVFPCM